MIPCDEDFERVGRWLDGEKVDLTAPQQALAEEMASVAADVGPALDVAPPPGVLHRVHARMKRAASAKPARSRIFRMGAAAAAAAAVVVAMLLLHIPAGPQPPRGELAAEVYLREFLKTPAPDLEQGIAVFEEELADAELRVMLDEPWSLELAIAGLEDEIDRQLAGEGPAADQDDWEEFMQSM